MSNLSPIESKKRRSELNVGTHLCLVHDMFLLKDATGAPQKIDGHPAVIVTFCTNEQKYADKMYIWDGGVKQKYFNDMINDTGIKIPQGQTVKKSEVLKKRIWVCVQEVHHVNNDKIVYDGENKPVIEYRIFKTLPFIEGKNKQLLKGDPDINGIASDQFVTYKNILKEDTFIVKSENIFKDQAIKDGEQMLYNKQAVKLDDVKLVEPTFETHTFEDPHEAKAADEFDYNTIPEFPHD